MRLEDLDLSGLDEVQEIPHDFEIDLHNLVVANHGFTMEAIDKSEGEGLNQISQDFANEDQETIASMMSHVQYFYDDLRQAARSLALVALVTRIQHWVGNFVKRAKTKIIWSRGGTQSKLASQLEALNNKLGVGPVPVLFFEELVTVRDSIIHHDSEATWEFPKGTQRKIADVYRNAYGRVELTDEQLKEARDKAVQQVKWYDEKIHAATGSKP